MGMVSVPIGSLVTGLNPSAAIHLLDGFIIARLLDSAFSPLQFPGNLPSPNKMIPETHKIECEPFMLLAP
ncbi:hypothetical protein DSO57_1018782 [Entomophthora muscae]|uniref:Uncharacterized protein n=1 Tax=Entomophthora muscae TaxID=34485 RepID=A0ACC2SH52_9FUNG|nr:hypothetical protein DSO57_1018782 [Entomophthora muscae]